MNVFVYIHSFVGVCVYIILYNLCLERSTWPTLSAEILRPSPWSLCCFSPRITRASQATPVTQRPPPSGTMRTWALTGTGRVPKRTTPAHTLLSQAHPAAAVSRMNCDPKNNSDPFSKMKKKSPDEDQNTFQAKVESSLNYIYNLLILLLLLGSTALFLHAIASRSLLTWLKAPLNCCLRLAEAGVLIWWGTGGFPITWFSDLGKLTQNKAIGLFF